MVLKVFNSMKTKKEVFKPLEKGKIKLFVCGPTVYDSSHLGHAKTYIQFDIITKYLKHKGFNVFYLQNITDLDDKIIIRAKEKNVPPERLAQRFKEEYYKDMEALGINSVTKYACATDYIEQIKNQIQTLLDKGYAYETEDGIYYDLSKFPKYGKLSGRTTLEAEDAVSRIDESINKRNKGDFCLWKRSKPKDPKWDSPWFTGRPGWHIEDTAITESHFGPQYDIHGGARDLMFPHHEAEIAQMEAASDIEPFVRYWLHTGFLTVEGRKMAKSLGNYVTIKDVIQNYDVETIRLFFSSAHYRSPINYSKRSLEHSKKSLEKLYNTLRLLHESIKSDKKITQDEQDFERIMKRDKEGFENAMDDDFDTPTAFRYVYNLSKRTNELIGKQNGEIDNKLAEKIFSTFKEFGEIFGILQKEIKKGKLPKEAADLIKEREKARKTGDYNQADAMRTELRNKYSIMVEDTPKGSKWKRIREK